MSVELKGFSWNTIGQVYKLLFSTILLVVLARFLSASDFGIVALASAILVFFNNFSNFGIDQAIVYSKTNNNSYYSSYFLVTVFTSIFLLLIALLISPLVSSFYDDQIAKVFQILSIGIFTNGIGAVPKGILQKELRFKELFFAEFVAITLAGILALILAYLQYGFWPLVVFQVLNISLYSILCFVMVRNSLWLIPDFSIQNIKQNFTFGGNILLFQTINFISQQSDIILIGKLLGNAEAGYYFLAYNIVFKPINAIVQAFNKTIYPVLTKIKDLTDQREKYQISTYSLFLLLTPLIICGVFYAQIFVPLFLTEKWISVLPLLFILGLQAILSILGSPSGTLFLVSGKPQLQWKYSLMVAIPLKIMGIWLGYKYIESSAMGLLTGVTAMNIIAVLIGFKITFKLINLNITSYFKPISKELVIFTMSFVLLLLNELYIKKELLNIVILIMISSSLLLYSYRSFSKAFELLKLEFKSKDL